MASHNNSINVLNWGIFYNYEFNCNRNAQIAITKEHLDILKVCYELNYIVTVDDIIQKVLTRNKNMFSWMVTVVCNLDKLILHLVQYDNIEYFKLLLVHKPSSNISGTEHHPDIRGFIKTHIAKYNATYILSYLLTNSWWSKFIKEPNNLFFHNTFLYTAIECGNIEVLRMVGLNPPKYCRNKYYVDLISYALHHQQYSIVEWINNAKLQNNSAFFR